MPISVPDLASQPAASDRAAPHRATPPRSKLFRLVFAAAICGFIAYLAVIAIVWPFTRAKLVDTLQQRSLRAVTIGHFAQTYLPPGMIAEDVRFVNPRDRGALPLLAVRRLVIESGYFRILTLQHHLSKVALIGLRITIPKEQPAGEPSPTMPLTYSSGSSGLSISQLTADDAHIQFTSGQPDDVQTQLAINKLQIFDITRDRPFRFHVLLSASVLPGEISATGTWGPWNPANPSGTPLRGTYAFHNGDLGHFEEFAGSLDSSGQFHGKLGAIQASGTIAVRDFQVKGTAHARELSVQYSAVVDGQKGDVLLPYTLAHFDNTALYAKGSIRGPGAHGKALDFDLYSDHARVEDLLRLFISTPRAPFSGDISLQGHVTVPSGSDAFVRRLQLNGGFGISGSEFTNPNVERELARVSVSATKGDKAEDRENPQSVLSDLAGNVIAKGGVARLQGVAFHMPGASAKLGGTYDLVAHSTDLTGTLFTSGNLSDGPSGIKSLLLKVVTPFFKKHGKVKQVPFRISGPFGHTSVSLNIGGKQK